MAGPWEQYQAAEAGPWARYAGEQPAAPMSGSEKAGRTVGDWMNSAPTVSDILASVMASVPKAVVGLPGMFADIPNAYGAGVDFVGRKIGGAITGKEPQPGEIYGPSDYKTGLFQAGGRDFQKAADVGLEAAGLPGLYEPKTQAGRVADTVGQFATTGGMLGGARAAVTGAGAGAGSEAAAAIPGVRGTAWEPPARLLAALLAGKATDAVMPSNNANAMLAKRLAENTPQDFAAARGRMQAGQQAGIPLSPAEAIDNRLIQALAGDTAATATGGPQMGKFLDQRAATLPGTIRNEIIPDMASAPGYLRQAGVRGADKAVGDAARQAGYTAANSQTLDRSVLQPVIERVGAIYAEAPKEVQPVLRRLYDNLTASGGNINRVDEARKIARDLIDSKFVATSAEQTAKHNATVRALAPLIDDLTEALKVNPDFRAGITKFATDKPSASVMTTMDDALEGAAKPTQAGPTRMAGVNFRNDLMGGPGSQAGELTMKSIRDAAMAQGRNPDIAAAAAERVFDVLERTGRIPGVGSQTGARLQAAQEASNPGLLGKAAEAVNITQGSVARTFQRALGDRYYAEAYKTLGDLFSNPSPKALDIMERIAKSPPGADLAPLLIPLQQEAQRLGQRP